MLTIFTKRSLHSAVPRELVENAIRKCIPQEKNINSIILTTHPTIAAKVITAACSAAKFTHFPDNLLSKIRTVKDLIENLCTPLSPPIVKGIPKFELFAGDEMPPNVTLINYRKRRWTASVYKSVIDKSLRDAGLLKQQRRTIKTRNTEESHI